MTILALVIALCPTASAGEPEDPVGSWRQRALRAEAKLQKQEPMLFIARAELRRLYEKWRCIHEREGAWNDPNAPHYGGLQFNDSFQRSYGPEFFKRWGDANHWPAFAQLVAANRAWEVRGYAPWPNTGRACKLIP